MPGVVTMAGRSSRLYISTPGGSFPLAAGHFVPAKGAMAAVYPRSDGTTTTWARHRKAYYDGVNSVQYRIPVGVRFGSWPYKFELIAGPSGMTVGQYLPSDWQTNGPGDYGVVTWTPSGTVTGATVTVRVTDQQLNTLDLTWTVSTTALTTDFIFISSTGNDSTGTGSYSAPFLTIAKAFGATRGGTSNPNTIIYFMTSSTFAVPAQTGNADTLLRSGASPMAMMGLPGVNPTLSFTAGCFSTAGTGNEVFLANMTWNSGDAAATPFRNFYVGGIVDRFTVWGVKVTNPVNGNTAPGNVSVFFMENAGGQKTNFYFRENTESGRAYDLQASAIFVSFGTQDSLAEFNVVSTAGNTMNLKSDAPRWTRRANRVTATHSQDMWMTICQIDNSVITTDVEDCYNTLDMRNVPGGTAGIIYNLGYRTGVGADVAGVHYVYRNTIYSRVTPRNAAVGNGPFTLEQNVIVSPSGSVIVTDGATATYTNTGTECQGVVGLGIINTTTLLLQGTYLTNYLGTRGAEIA